VTCRNPHLRLLECRSRYGFDGMVEIIAMFDSRARAMALERKLRSDWNMELNRARGGGASYNAITRDAHINNRAVVIDGKRYGSLTLASEALGIGVSLVHWRVRARTFPSWKYAGQQTSKCWLGRSSQPRK
jgi:hypothetical protein